MELKRKIYQKMLHWKETSEGSSSLLIEGARRVGKSYVATSFAKAEYESYLLIDFSNVTRQLLDIFENDTMDLDLFFSKLSVFYGVHLVERHSVIIFDEIQMYPRARQLLKHFVADGRYDYIETGSLITLKQNVENIVIPSEEEKITMYPMDFEEFLWAMGDDVTVPYLRDCFEKRHEVGEAVHRKTMNLFRQYMLVGGMPQAVLTYAASKDFEKTDRVKRRILELYRNDVTKFAKGYESKVLAIFDGIPSQLSRHEKKYRLTSLQKEAKFRDYEDSFMWLDEAMIINTCFNSSDPNVGLTLHAERLTLKCYMADTGLLLSLAFSDKELLEEGIYKAILFDRLNLNEGMLMENIVAQTLKTNGYHLYFYSRNDREHMANRMELDFLISKGKRISAIEVKSSGYANHVSLDKFRNKFAKKIGPSYMIYTKDLKLVDGILCIPIYMTMFL